MWRVDGYTAVAAFADKFTVRRHNSGQGMHQDTQEKLLSEMKRRIAENVERRRTRSADDNPNYSIATGEDAPEIEDEEVWRSAQYLGRQALHRFLVKTPLFLVGPGVAEPISNSIVKEYFWSRGANSSLSSSDLHFPLLSSGQFTVSAKEIVKMAKAAKALKIQAVALGFTKNDLQTLDKLAAYRSTAEILLPYEGYSLSVKDSDVPDNSDVAGLLFPSRSEGEAKPMGRPRLQERAADLFQRLYPNGRGKTPWKQVLYRLELEGVSVSETTLKRAIGQKA